MSESYTEVTNESWGSRLISSIKGLAVGALLFLLAFPVLFWNEGKEVRRMSALETGKGACVSLAKAEVSPENEGKLVHFSAPLVLGDKVGDPITKIDAKAVTLTRNVKMYQWVEKKNSTKRKKLGGGTETMTNYSYKLDWTDKAVDSSKFKVQEGHQNPGSMPYKKETFQAKDVKAGGFELPSSLVSSIGGAKTMALAGDALEKLPAELREKSQIQGNTIYVGEDPATPRIGDMKIEYSIVEPGTVSIVSQQSGNTLKPFPAGKGETIHRLQRGTHTADAMFTQAKAQAKNRTWIVRVVGFLLMTIGLALVFKPLSVLADVVPFIGDLVGAGMTLVAGCIALGLSLITISIAWLFYRPLIGVPLLVVGVAAIVFLLIKSRKSAQPQAA